MNSREGKGAYLVEPHEVTEVLDADICDPVGAQPHGVERGMPATTGGELGERFV